jgi:hypothetical protein
MSVSAWWVAISWFATKNSIDSCLRIGSANGHKLETVHQMRNLWKTITARQIGGGIDGWIETLVGSVACTLNIFFLTFRAVRRVPRKCVTKMQLKPGHSENSVLPVLLWIETLVLRAWFSHQNSWYTWVCLKLGTTHIWWLIIIFPHEEMVVWGVDALSADTLSWMFIRRIVHRPWSIIWSTQWKYPKTTRNGLDSNIIMWETQWHNLPFGDGVYTVYTMHFWWFWGWFMALGHDMCPGLVAWGASPRVLADRTCQISGKGFRL